MELNLAVKVAKVGPRYLAVASVGGINVAGPVCNDELEAVQQLMFKLAPGGDPQASIGLAMALGGQTIADFGKDEPEPPKAVNGGAE